MADNRRWFLCRSQDGYVALEKASCATEAAHQAAARPGYEGCTAEPYELIAEQEYQEKQFASAAANIKKIMESLTADSREPPIIEEGKNKCTQEL